ncbi:octaprenyl diphosphate synthase [Oleiphilus sp. HI0130]|nr:octaprenyl diphosphate synthase [Oleiphilus sp. HI0130]
MQLTDIYKSVESEFDAVNSLIIEQLSSRVPLVEKIAQYIVESGGKRMRPLVTLLTAKALGKSDQETIKLASIIEFLHTATLLHDDVVDTSDLRRGKATANANWGNAPSVLVGDFLYSRAFQMMVEIGNMGVMSVLANATNVIAEGEVFQLMNAKNPDISEEQYFDVIEYKTAMLFVAASHGAAKLGSASDTQQQAAKDFGLQLGLAFQLVDDILDYSGDIKQMGKNTGDDLAEGKTTLPLIFAMREGSEQQRTFIRNAIRRGEREAISEVIAIVQATGALEYTLEAAEKCKNKAIDAAQQLGQNIHSEALGYIAELSVNRDK